MDKSPAAMGKMEGGRESHFTAMWLGYLVYSIGNCIIKLCIETGLKGSYSYTCDRWILFWDVCQALQSTWYMTCIVLFFKKDFLHLASILV